MEYEEYRITKLREYLMTVIEEINTNYEQLNINFLSNDVNNYSLDKIPSAKKVEGWILGAILEQETYSFRSRMNYSPEVINNIKNIGFFEKLENIIKIKNEDYELPEIEGIESIECLNCGTINRAGTNTAEFDIQIQIKYRTENKKEVASL